MPPCFCGSWGPNKPKLTVAHFQVPADDHWDQWQLQTRAQAARIGWGATGSSRSSRCPKPPTDRSGCRPSMIAPRQKIERPEPWHARPGPRVWLQTSGGPELRTASSNLSGFGSAPGLQIGQVQKQQTPGFFGVCGFPDFHVWV